MNQTELAQKLAEAEQRGRELTEKEADKSKSSLTPGQYPSEDKQEGALEGNPTPSFFSDEEVSCYTCGKIGKHPIYCIECYSKLEQENTALKGDKDTFEQREKDWKKEIERAMDLLHKEGKHSHFAFDCEGCLSELAEAEPYIKLQEENTALKEKIEKMQLTEEEAKQIFLKVRFNEMYGFMDFTKALSQRGIIKDKGEKK